MVLDVLVSRGSTLTFLTDFRKVQETAIDVYLGLGRRRYGSLQWACTWHSPGPELLIDKSAMLLKMRY